jgi:hypothetical protein
MNLEQLVDSLPELHRQLADADARADDAIQRAEAAQREADTAIAERNSLLTVISGLEAFAVTMSNSGGGSIVVGVADSGDPVTVDVAPTKRIRGRNAVRRVMRERGRPMKPREIIEAVIDKGWVERDALDPAASIRQATRRLLDDLEVERLADGRYRLIEDSSASPDDVRQQELLGEEGR